MNLLDSSWCRLLYSVLLPFNLVSATVAHFSHGQSFILHMVTPHHLTFVCLVFKVNSGVVNMEPPAGWSRMRERGRHRRLDYRSCLGYLAHFKSTVLETSLNVRFQKCATHRVVSVRLRSNSKYRSEIKFLSCFLFSIL